jgi:hypothetical protein
MARAEECEQKLGIRNLQIVHKSLISKSSGIVLPSFISRYR